MAKEPPFLDVQMLTKSFGALTLFENISFSVAAGQKVGLIAKTVRASQHFCRSLPARIHPTAGR